MIHETIFEFTCKTVYGNVQVVQINSLKTTEGIFCMASVV